MSSDNIGEATAAEIAAVRDAEQHHEYHFLSVPVKATTTQSFSSQNQVEKKDEETPSNIESDEMKTTTPTEGVLHVKSTSITFIPNIHVNQSEDGNDYHKVIISLENIKAVEDGEDGTIKIHYGHDSAYEDMLRFWVQEEQDRLFIASLIRDIATSDKDLEAIVLRHEKRELPWPEAATVQHRCRVQHVVSDTRTRGEFILVDSKLHFQSFSTLLPSRTEPEMTWDSVSVSRVDKKSIEDQDVALDIILKTGETVFLVLDSTRDRDILYNELIDMGVSMRTETIESDDGEIAESGPASPSEVSGENMVDDLDKDVQNTQPVRKQKDDTIAQAEISKISEEDLETTDDEGDTPKSQLKEDQQEKYRILEEQLEEAKNRELELLSQIGELLDIEKNLNLSISTLGDQNERFQGRIKELEEESISQQDLIQALEVQGSELQSQLNEALEEIKKKDLQLEESDKELEFEKGTAAELKQILQELDKDVQLRNAKESIERLKRTVQSDKRRIDRLLKMTNLGNSTERLIEQLEDKIHELNQEIALLKEDRRELKKKLRMQRVPLEKKIGVLERQIQESDYQLQRLSLEKHEESEKRMNLEVVNQNLVTEIRQLRLNVSFLERKVQSLYESTKGIRELDDENYIIPHEITYVDGERSARGSIGPWQSPSSPPSTRRSPVNRGTPRKLRPRRETAERLPIFDHSKGRVDPASFKEAVNKVAEDLEKMIQESDAELGIIPSVEEELTKKEEPKTDGSSRSRKEAIASPKKGGRGAATRNVMKARRAQQPTVRRPHSASTASPSTKRRPLTRRRRRPMTAQASSAEKIMKSMDSLLGEEVESPTATVHNGGEESSEAAVVKKFVETILDSIKSSAATAAPNSRDKAEIPETAVAATIEVSDAASKIPSDPQSAASVTEQVLETAEDTDLERQKIIASLKLTLKPTNFIVDQDA